MGRAHWLEWLGEMGRRLQVEGLDFLVSAMEHNLMQSHQARALPWHRVTLVERNLIPLQARAATTIQSIFQGRKGRAEASRELPKAPEAPPP